MQIQTIQKYLKKDDKLRNIYNKTMQLKQKYRRGMQNDIAVQIRDLNESIKF